MHGVHSFHVCALWYDSRYNITSHQDQKNKERINRERERVKSY